jgi:signal-transduction protein with cAMP-binding, CBS, and nucleotidyltransferase domain
MQTTDRQKLMEELQRRPPFDRIPKKNLQWLADHMELVKIGEGEVIIAPGECGKALYFIHSGLVQLEAVGSTAENLKVLAELVEGESFPLEALEEDRPVFSTFRAKTATECYCLSKVDFIAFRSLDKVFADFCH